MSLYEAIRPFAFMLDPERAHDLGMRAIASGLVTGRTFSHRRLQQTIFGIPFANPVGLAAGFDKNAIAVKAWPRFGFGFAELGTVTARPQPGNPKPRLFRIPEDFAIVNRMGFNNDGAAAVAERLVGVHPEIPIGINIGKSKITPIERATEDYLASARHLAPFGQYFVVNVSSPNTPGLRSLQEREPLLELLSALRKALPKPIFVKIAPDLEEPALREVIEVVVEANVAGIVATNTTIGREGLTQPFEEKGGLSGLPLRDKARTTLRFLARHAPRHLILIGVGGIFTGEDLYDRIASGAHLCQIYTSWVYGGPDTVAEILEECVNLMERDGIRSLEELRCSGL